MTAGTYSKVTVDAKGRVTGTAIQTIADVKSSLGANPNFLATGVACANGYKLDYSPVTDTIDCVAYNLTSSQVTTALGFTPANGSNYVAKAGDTMTGTLNLPSNGLAVGTNELVVNGGKVGVGTSSPQANLEVNGSVRMPALADKTSDVNYSKVLKIDPSTGDIAKGDAIQANITINGALTTTVNHIYPDPVPDPVTYPTEVIALMGEYKNKTFTDMVQTDYFFNYDALDISSLINYFTNGTYRFGGNSKTDTNYAQLWSMITRDFPHDKKWIVELTLAGAGTWEYWCGTSTNTIGISQNASTTTFNQTSIANYAFQFTQFINGYNSSKVIYAHANNAVNVLRINSNGSIEQKIEGNLDQNGTYRFLVVPQHRGCGNQLNTTIISGRYWIEP